MHLFFMHFAHAWSMPNLLDLCIHGCILCPAVNTPMGDKCLQLGLTIGVCRRILSACRGQTGAGDVAPVLFSCSGCCLPADVGLRSRLGFKCGRWHCADIQFPIPSANWTVYVCLCVCGNEWVITLDIYINQFIKSLDVQQSNVHNWHVQSLSASGGDMI